MCGSVVGMRRRRAAPRPAAVPPAAPAPAARRRGPAAWPACRSMTAAPIEWPISTGGADSCRRDVLDVGDVVVEARDEQRVVRRRSRRGRAATARARASRAPRTTAGSTAPSTTRRSSRRGRTAAAACATLPLPRAGRRERTSRSSIGREAWRVARCAGMDRRRGGESDAAGPSRRVLRFARHACPHPTRPPFCQMPTRVRRRTTTPAAAARGSRRSWTKCAPSIPTYWCRPVPPFGARRRARS